MTWEGVPVRQHNTNAETILRCGVKRHECGRDDGCCSAHARSKNEVSGETTIRNARVPGEA